MADMTAPLTGPQANMLTNLARANKDLIDAARATKDRLDGIIEAAKTATQVRGFANALGSSADDVNALVARRKALIEAVFAMGVPQSVVLLAASDAKSFFMEGETFEEGS